MPSRSVVIPPPNFQTGIFKIRGTAPYVQNKFSQKALEMMRQAQEEDSTKKSKKPKREPKNFQETYEQAKHISRQGWIGIPAGSIRKAMISACRIVSFKMTLAKLSVFVESDGFDATDGTPLIKITHGEPHVLEARVLVGIGQADIRWRPQWDEDWTATVRIRFDADQFSIEDVTNLLSRVGLQVGLGEGRPDSKNSAGMGWGTFEIVNE